MNAEQIRQKLKELDLSAAWLARKMKVSGTLMYWWLNGTRPIPDNRKDEIKSILNRMQEAAA